MEESFYRTTKQIHAQDNHMLSSLKKDFIPFEEECAIRPKGGVRSARVLPYSKTRADLSIHSILAGLL